MAVLTLVSGCAGAQSGVPGAPEAMSSRAGFAFPDPDSAAVLHALNRLAFAPRPGDIARVQRMGFAAWLDQQLAPGGPDGATAAVRERWPVAFLSPRELVLRYPPPQPNVARRPAPEGGDRAPARGDSMAPPPPRPPDARGYRELGASVMMATLERHVASEHQLLEVMADVWTNHFNVFMGKQADRWLTADYIERAIRPSALGRFEDLLIATARHPAMLVYLDNAMSVAPGATPARARRGAAIRIGAGRSRGFPPAMMPPRTGQGTPPAQSAPQMPTGINENYARELLELHTLGVDGGYTQADVQQVARILTGWSVARPQERGGAEPLAFEFRDWAHDRGAKTVLGERFPAGHGMDEGLRLLRMLAAHPATARHVSYKLCERLVADEPPDGCVDRAVAAWRHSGGEIAVVIRAIVASPEFWAPQYRAAKTKSPLEFFVAALRATGARPDGTPRAVLALQQLGQPLFMQPVPTGYPEASAEWINSGALLARMNVAVAIAAGRLPGVTLALDSLVPATTDIATLVARVNAVVLGGSASANTLRVLAAQLADVRDPHAARALAVGLALGSPEFQRQ
jgi:uncharacterized protein (DUF1800 family)